MMFLHDASHHNWQPSGLASKLGSRPLLHVCIQIDDEVDRKRAAVVDIQLPVRGQADDRVVRARLSTPVIDRAGERQTYVAWIQGQPASGGRCDHRDVQDQ